jgi:hypothetical protein
MQQPWIPYTNCGKGKGNTTRKKGEHKNDAPPCTPQTENSDTCYNRLALSLLWCTCNFNALVLTIVVVVVGWVLESNFMSWILGGRRWEGVLKSGY